MSLLDLLDPPAPAVAPLVVLSAALPPPAAVVLPAVGGRDLRPDLAEDSRLWGHLLTWAWTETGEEPEGAYGALSGARMFGARLAALANGRLRIVAGEDFEGDWATERERWLVPHRATISRWLRLVAEAEREVAPR